jgi:hypothetical protein
MQISNFVMQINTSNNNMTYSKVICFTVKLFPLLRMTCLQLMAALYLTQALYNILRNSQLIELETLVVSHYKSEE